MIEVVEVCPFCGEIHSVVVPAEGYFAWQSGELIQNALPMLTPTQREQIISGICPRCQNSIFKNYDEDEDIDIGIYAFLGDLD